MSEPIEPEIPEHSHSHAPAPMGFWPSAFSAVERVIKAFASAKTFTQILLFFVIVFALLVLSPGGRDIIAAVGGKAADVASATFGMDEEEDPAGPSALIVPSYEDVATTEVEPLEEDMVISTTEYYPASSMAHYPATSLDTFIVEDSLFLSDSLITR